MSGELIEMKGDLIYNPEDVMKMLDAFLADRGGSWWDDFYDDREALPFFR